MDGVTRPNICRRAWKVLYLDGVSSLVEAGPLELLHISQ